MEVVDRTSKACVLLLVMVSCLASAAPAQEPNNPPPTFNRDVAPILQKHCVTCHRPGEAAPFFHVDI